MTTLIQRLQKRAEKERKIADNSAAVFDLLKPEYDKWEAHEGPFNLYAVRMAVDHRLSAERDAEFADDLVALIAENALLREAGTALLKRIDNHVREVAEPLFTLERDYMRSALQLKDES